MKTVGLVLSLLLAAPALAAETTLHGTYGGSAVDLRNRFADAVTLYFKRYSGHVGSDGVGRASYGKDPVEISLEIADDTHYTLTVSAREHDGRYTAKWADELRKRL